MDKVEFKKGQIVKHLLTNKPMIVLEFGREQIKCRTEDLREIWFYPFEIEKV